MARSRAELDDWRLRIALQYLLRQLRVQHPECFTQHGALVAIAFRRWLDAGGERPPDEKEAYRLLNDLLHG